MPRLHPCAQAFGSSGDTGWSRQIKTRYCRSCCSFLRRLLLRKMHLQQHWKSADMALFS